MDELPNEIIVQIALECEYRDVVRFSRTNRRIHNLCMNINFWDEKALKEFGMKLIVEDLTPEKDPFVKTKLTASDVPNEFIRRYLETQSAHLRTKRVFTIYFDESSMYSRMASSYYKRVDDMITNSTKRLSYSSLKIIDNDMTYVAKLVPLAKTEPKRSIQNNESQKIVDNNITYVAQVAKTKFKRSIRNDFSPKSAYLERTRYKPKIVLENKKSQNYRKGKIFRH